MSDIDLFSFQSAFHDLSSRPYVSSVLQEFLKTVSISDASVGNLGDYIKIVTKEVKLFSKLPIALF